MNWCLRQAISRPQSYKTMASGDSNTNHSWSIEFQMAFSDIDNFEIADFELTQFEIPTSTID